MSHLFTEPSIHPLCIQLSSFWQWKDCACQKYAIKMCWWENRMIAVSSPMTICYMKMVAPSDEPYKMIIQLCTSTELSIVIGSVIVWFHGTFTVWFIHTTLINLLCSSSSRQLSSAKSSNKPTERYVPGTKLETGKIHNYMMKKKEHLAKQSCTVPNTCTFLVWYQTWSINDISRREVICHREQLFPDSAPWGSGIYCRWEQRKLINFTLFVPKGLSLIYCSCTPHPKSTASYNALFWHLWTYLFVFSHCFKGNTDKWLITKSKSNYEGSRSQNFNVFSTWDWVSF